MSSPQVSVTMAVCNVDRFLAESIESILGQTFRDFEFIIVDFGSTDNSKSIAAKYAAMDDRIRLHEVPNCPLPKARNAACFQARGRYIAVMDADDVAVPQRLEWQTEYMDRHPEIAIVGGAVDWIDATGRSLGTQFVPTANHQIQSTLRIRCPFWHPTILMRKDAFASVGGYREAFVCAHDYDLELRIAEYFECANLQQSVLKYRIHPSQLTFHKQSEQTLCKLAAQASAESRRSRKLDPLNAAGEITPDLLTTLGVSAEIQKNALAADCRNWIRSMTAAGEYRAASQAARQLLTSNLDLVEPWQVADLHLTLARLYWKQGRFMKSLCRAFRALVRRPLMLVRPLKPLLQSFGFQLQPNKQKR